MKVLVKPCKRSLSGVYRLGLLVLVLPFLFTSCSFIKIWLRRDRDQDGIVDKKDRCPDTPTGVRVDANGCPLDTDGDGVADNQDKCPDVKGLAALQGCPDADGDGVADDKDKCPNTPTGVKVDANGCPLDRDGDGVPDYLDKCPDQAGPASNKGCPEIKVESKGVLDRTTRYIQFDTNSQILEHDSFPELRRIVQILNTDPNYRLSIAGHTDNQEDSSDGGLRLAEERAASARTFLLNQGVSAEKIEARSYGDIRPMADNNTYFGRSENRRVDFDLFITGEANPAEVKYGLAPVSNQPRPRKVALGRDSLHSKSNLGTPKDSSARQESSMGPDGCITDGSAVFNIPQEMETGKEYDIVLSLVRGVVDSLQPHTKGTSPRKWLPKTTITAHSLITNSYLGYHIIPNERNIKLERMRITRFMSVQLSADDSYIKVTPEGTRILSNIRSDTIEQLVWKLETKKAGKELPLNFEIRGSCDDMSLKSSAPIYQKFSINVTDPKKSLLEQITESIEWLRKNIVAVAAILGALSAIYIWFKNLRTGEA